MPVPLVCSYNPPQSKPSKKKLSQTRRQALEAKVAAHQAMLAANAKTPSAAEMLKRAEFQKLIAHRSIDLQDFVGVKANKFTTWVAEYLGQYIGKEGNLVKGFYENKRNASNLLKFVAHNNSFKTTEPMVKQFKQLAKARKVDAKLHNKLMADLFEVGSTKFDYTTSGETQAVKELLQQRNAKFAQDMKAAGFTQNDIDALVLTSHNASEAFEELRLFMSEVGMNIEKLDNIGYFPRILTKDAVDYMSAKKLFEGVRAKDGGVRADFAKKRTSYWFTVEDRDELAKLLGLSTQEMDDMMLDTAKLKLTIEEMVSDEALEMLIDSGLMSKVPMTSSELFEWMSTRYPMPFGNSFDDYFVTNPKMVLEGYVRELESAVGSHGIARSLRDQGNAKGIISDVARDADDVPVSSLQSGEFLEANGVTGYVHREVGRLIDTATGIEKSPHKMAGLAQAFNAFSSAARSQMLANPQYVVRIFLGNTIQYASRGGDIPSLVSGISDVTKFMLKGIDSFDNTQPYRVIDGKSVTHKEFMQMFVSARGMSSAPSVDGLKRGSGDYSALNPLLFPKKLGLMASIARDLPLGESFSYVFGETLGQYKKASQSILAPFATAAGYADMVFKYALAKAVTKTDNAAWDTVRQGLRLATVADSTLYDSFDDVLDHIDRAYLTFDNMGKAPKALSSVIPFFSFTFQNMSAVTRDLFRNPAKYIAAARVGSMVYDDVQEQQSIGNEASLPFFQREDFPIKVFQDENGNYGTLSITNLSPLLSAAQDAQLYARLFGVRNVVKQSTEDERKQSVDNAVGAERTAWQNRLADFFNKTTYGSFFNSVTGKAGRAVDSSENTFVGVPMGSDVEGVLRVAAPFLGYINSQNPLEVFGTRETLLGDEVDLASGADKVLDAKESVFGTDRTDYDNRAALWKRNPLLGAMARIGFNVSYVEGKSNVRNYYSGLERDLSRLKKGYEELSLKQVQKPSPANEARLKEVVTLYNKYEKQRLALQQYMMDNNINDAQLEKQLKTRRVTLESINKKYAN